MARRCLAASRKDGCASTARAAPRTGENGADGEFLVLQHWTDMADHLPPGKRRRIESGEAGRDDAVEGTPKLIDARKATQPGLPSHVDEQREETPPHDELPEHKSMDENRGRPVECLRLRQGGWKHRVDHREVWRLGGNHGAYLRLTAGEVR